ncbi:hypothetical protein JXQ31_12150, partial [candidate division KSB1 bacterium]|nr:hypothetical protein [candidate division KSB1 bacterium]
NALSLCLNPNYILRKSSNSVFSKLNRTLMKLTITLRGLVKKSSPANQNGDFIFFKYIGELDQKQAKHILFYAICINNNIVRHIRSWNAQITINPENSVKKQM